jgi:hypothetical protein
MFTRFLWAMGTYAVLAARKPASLYFSLDYFVINASLPR